MVQGVVVFQMDWCWDVSPPMLGSPIARHPVFPTPGLFFWDAVRDSLRFAGQFLKFIICIVVSNYKQLVFILYIYLVSELSILIGHFLAIFEALYPTRPSGFPGSLDGHGWLVHRPTSTRNRRHVTGSHRCTVPLEASKDHRIGWYGLFLWDYTFYKYL